MPLARDRFRLVNFQAPNDNDLSHASRNYTKDVELNQKQDRLIAAFSEMSSVIVAYSGGADSAYLAWAAQRALRDRALAVTAHSASLRESHKREAEEFPRA